MHWTFCVLHGVQLVSLIMDVINLNIMPQITDVFQSTAIREGSTVPSTQYCTPQPCRLVHSKTNQYRPVHLKHATRRTLGKSPYQYRHKNGLHASQQRQIQLLYMFFVLCLRHELALSSSARLPCCCNSYHCVNMNCVLHNFLSCINNHKLCR